MQQEMGDGTRGAAFGPGLPGRVARTWAGRAGGGRLGMDCGTGFFLRAKPTFLGMAEQPEVKGAVIWCVREPAGKPQISSQAHARSGAAFSGSPFLPHSKY